MLISSHHSDDPGASTPFALRDRSHPISVCYMPSDAVIARRRGLHSLPVEFPCYELGGLMTSFDCGTSTQRESLRSGLIDKFHALSFFTRRHEIADYDVAQSWHKFVLANSTSGIRGARVMTRTHLRNLHHAINQAKMKWMSTSEIGCPVKLHFACENEAFPCAIGPISGCKLCFAENPVMSARVRRGQAARQPSIMLHRMIASCRLSVEKQPATVRVSSRSQHLLSVQRTATLEASSTQSIHSQAMAVDQATTREASVYGRALGLADATSVPSLCDLRDISAEIATVKKDCDHSRTMIAEGQQLQDLRHDTLEFRIEEVAEDTKAIDQRIRRQAAELKTQFDGESKARVDARIASVSKRMDNRIHQVETHLMALLADSKKDSARIRELEARLERVVSALGRRKVRGDSETETENEGEGEQEDKIKISLKRQRKE